MPGSSPSLPLWRAHCESCSPSTSGSVCFLSGWAGVLLFSSGEHCRLHCVTASTLVPLGQQSPRRALSSLRLLWSALQKTPGISRLRQAGFTVFSKTNSFRVAVPRKSSASFHAECSDSAQACQAFFPFLNQKRRCRNNLKGKRKLRFLV